jgi:Restriction endonuclease
MVSDRLYVPGLHEPLSAGEYAKLEGLDEKDVIEAAFHRTLSAVYLRGNWYLEAPPYSEQRLSRLRGESKLEPRLANWLRQRVALHHDAQYNSEIERLRVQFVKSHWRYERLTPAQQQALLSTKQYAERPQPADFGLSRGDLYAHRGSYPLTDGLTYAKDRWECGVPSLLAVGYICAFIGLASLGVLPSWGLVRTMAIAAGFSVMLLGILVEARDRCFYAYVRKRSRPSYLRYQEALELHELYQTTAQVAVHEAEQALLRKKRSYWEVLDGYAFELATAEVLKRHQFNPRLTPGSADGGVDIEVTRNGLKGVVQCKAHVACVGPHVVRDLYGVIHHCGANFGIIVSRGGFTKGAIEFARDKPILFLDTSDLIAMQEGRDVLATAFAPRDANTASRQQ